jgi:hypothetical protein
MIAPPARLLAKAKRKGSAAKKKTGEPARAPSPSTLRRGPSTPLVAAPGVPSR